ncbi:hypothetical protein HYW67_00770 [Candidatus Parcubacteria bacterium]|nr:hypothetical protein [Candidatus Parcubacteria bacterium]
METQQTSATDTRIPGGITFVVVLCYTIAALNILHLFLPDSITTGSRFYGFFVSILSSIGFNALLNMVGLGNWAYGGSSHLVFSTIDINLTSLALVGMSVVWFLMGRALSARKRVSRIFAIVGFAPIGIIGAIWSVYQSEFFYFLSFFALPINVLASAYLIFSKKVRAVF